MVAVLHAAQEAGAPQTAAAWLDTLRGIYPDEDRDAFGAALAYARERCGATSGREGQPLLDRAVGAAMILAGLRLDAGTVQAALLTGLAGANAFAADDLAARFGDDVATLVAGVARMDDIRATPPQGDAAERAAQAERLRKMLLAMVEDIRVVLIKLAERTAALRFLMTAGPEATEARQRTAREVLDLFAPLANRLGVWQLKWELEDLSLRALEPAAYKSIATMLDERRLDRQRYIEDVIAVLVRELGAAGVRAEITGRREAHLQHLGQDAAQAVGHRQPVRHPRRADPRRRRQGLLRRARHRPSPVGAAVRASSTTTSRSRRRTTTARCIRR